MDISRILNYGKLDPSCKKPLYHQVADIIREKIRDKNLEPATRLPPERELADLFGVSRITAINAYRRLEQEGLVKTRVGSGTYVRENPEQDTAYARGIPWAQYFTPYPQTPTATIISELLSTPVSGSTISLAAGMPDPSFYPVQAFKALTNEYLDEANPLDLGYIPIEGYFPLRKAVASLLREKGIGATENNIMVLTGSQQGLYLTSKALLEQGDYVIVESPTYIGAIQTFQSCGARILTLPATGPFPMDLFEDYLIRYRPKMFYIIPSFQNPTGRELPKEEGRELLKLAARHRLVILEDGPYSDLFYGEKPPTTLKSLDPNDLVVYLGTFSKTLAPGLRMGYVCASPLLINRLVMEKQLADLHSSNISQLLLAYYLRENGFNSHLVFLRKEYKKRRDALARALQRFCRDDLDFTVPAGGFYLWCKITTPVTAKKLLDESTKNGLFFVPGQAFYVGPEGEKEFRLCFATHKEEVLVEAAQRLAKSLEHLEVNKGRNRSAAKTSNVIV